MKSSSTLDRRMVGEIGGAVEILQSILRESVLSGLRMPRSRCLPAQRGTESGLDAVPSACGRGCGLLGRGRGHDLLRGKRESLGVCGENHGLEVVVGGGSRAEIWSEGRLERFAGMRPDPVGRIERRNHSGLGTCASDRMGHPAIDATRHQRTGLEPRSTTAIVSSS